VFTTWLRLRARLAGVLSALVLGSVLLANVASAGNAHLFRPSGTHEVMIPVAPPTFMAAFTTRPGIPQEWVVDKGSERTFEIDNSPPFVAADQSGPSLLKPGQPESNAYRMHSACVTYQGTGLLNGTGVDSACNPLKSAAQTDVAITIVPDWPTKGSQLYLWSHLPAGVKYVTYSYVGSDRVWVSPIKHVAAVLVPRPAAFDGNYGVWNKAPFPKLEAFNANGKIIAVEDAPRIGGDRVPVLHP
jgi:hypothetical protein